jgi:hypothetical protein
MLSLLLVGCGTSSESDAGTGEKSRFVCVEKNINYRVMADRETGVMYVMSCGAYNCGTFTLMVDADGNPLIYEGVTE